MVNNLTGAVVAEANKEKDKPFIAYFDIIKEHTISFSNSITDYHLEDNTAIQDHISHAPLTITLSGMRGELTYTPSDTDIQKELQTAKALTVSRDSLTVSRDGLTQASKLRPLNMFLPPVSNAMSLARNVATYVANSIARYYGIFKSWSNTNYGLNQYQGIGFSQTNTKLEEVCAKLRSLSANNTALIVQTPYQSFQDMYIESVTLTQGEQNYVTDIQVTLKQLRFAEVTTTKPDENVMSQYTAYQRVSDENNGKVGNRKSELAKIWDSNMGKV